MPGYTIAIQKDSPVYKLYQKLKADGVKDADLDTGYPETDYVKKTRTTVHKGDHKIEETEVLNYALEHYERYQLAIKETTGYVVPWSLDDLDPSTDFDAQIRDRVDRAISEVKQILSVKELKEGTDKHSELLAISLFAFARAPKPKIRLGMYETTTIPKNIRRELEKYGLKEVADYLATYGGLARSRMEKDCALEATALDALAKRCGYCSEESYILYGVFRMAGLKAKMIFVRPDHVSIGLPLGNKTRLFDLSQGLSNAEPFYKTHNTPLWSEQTDIEFLSFYYNNLGHDYIEQGRSRLAVAAMRQALGLNPHRAFIRKNLSEVIHILNMEKPDFVY